MSMFRNLLMGLGKIPSQYREIIGMQMDSDCYYKITGFVLTGADTVRFSFRTSPPPVECNLFGSFKSSTANNNYSLYIRNTSGTKYLRYDGGTYNSYFASNKNYNVVISPTGTQGFERDSTWEENEFECEPNLYIGTVSETSTVYKFKGSLYGHFIVDNRLNLIPCERVSDGIIGYYDTYTSIFYEPIGTNPTSLGYV